MFVHVLSLCYISHERTLWLNICFCLFQTEKHWKYELKCVFKPTVAVEPNVKDLNCPNTISCERLFIRSHDHICSSETQKQESAQTCDSVAAWDVAEGAKDVEITSCRVQHLVWAQLICGLFVLTADWLILCRVTMAQDAPNILLHVSV